MSTTNTLTERVQVRAPVNTVFDCWSRFESFPTFMAGVDSVERIDAARTRWMTSIGGVRRGFDAALVGRIRNEYLEWETTDGEVSHHGTVRFERIADDATTVVVRLEWQPFGVLEHAGHALGLDRRQLRSDLHRFKELIEAEPRRAAAIAGAALQ
ncbi:MAG: SRPBCC family protein [Catenulispora sp.]|nr:SRPBCC family protein [Catenulispora sp.]